jgi:drug/metabolite transporter (DMT)-like permease
VGKKIINKYDPWAFTVWAFIIGSASFLPLAVYEFIHIPNLYPSISFQGYFGIGYGALFSSAAGYGLFGWGLSKITATDASLFSYVDPVVGTIVAFFLLHEPITAPFVLGATLIFGGIFIAEGRLNYHPIRKIIALGQTIIDEIPHKKISKKAVLASIFKR